MGDFIYVSYAEVTEYVQYYGLGNYTVADLVTNKGNGGSLGYLGCWGMVVVYENSNMKWRDITLFDGYASLHQDFYELEIPIEGFRTVQVGRVNMKLGMMAAEGDRNMAGDSCFIQKQSDNSWFPLIHDGADSLSNFFNSSIQTGGNYRYPNYVNNTGIDIIVMDVPNDNNQIITNEQTSTAFKFTTRPRYVEAGDHEQYHPFCFVMGVDAYVPDAEAISGVMHLDTTVFWDDEAGYYTIPPGSIVEFEVSVKNFGTEDILDAKLEIPLPNAIEYYDTEVLYTYPGVTADFYFDAERNANGTAGWNINYLWSGDPNQVYVKVKLICKVTEDCYVLASTDEDCLLALHVNGTLEGTSYVNHVYFKKGSFISGFRDGECAGDAIRNDILVVVDKEGWIAENCDVNIDYTHREINICGNIFMDEDTATIDAIPFMEIYNLYPQGSRFFHPETNQEYTIETGFPIPELFGEVILVQSSSIYSAECSSELMLNNLIDNDGFIDEENLINTSSVTYCLGEDARPLSELITIENPDKYYVRFYRDSSGSAPAELDIIPNTNELGTVTYYVRQFLKNTIGCEDDQYYPITVTVVSPITLSADRPLPTCYGEEVNITATPAGGTFSYSEELEDHIEVNGNVLTIKTTMPAGSVFITYTHNNIVDNTTGCEISQLTYEHQIAQPTIHGVLSQDGTICEGSQIFPLEITEHTGHIERWEWTTTDPQAETTVWNIIPNNTTIITSEDLGNLSAGNYYFRALIKDGNCAPDWTNTIHIEVLSAPAPDPLTFVSPQYACIGTEYEIQVPDSTVTYHWYSKPIGGWPDDDLRNVTVTNSWVTRYVSVVSSNENECESIRSEIVVRPNVDPGIISSAGQFVCEIGSDPVTIGSQPTDDRDGQAHVFPSGTVEYQWYVTTTNENGTTSTELISGATLETFTPTDYMSQEGVFIFTRKVKAVGCNDWQQSDGSWRLSIGNPDATISTSPTSILPCNPSVETPITLTAVGPGTKYSYKWYYNDVEITGSVSQTIQVTNPGEYKVQVTHKNSGCVATTTIPISIVIDTQAPSVEDAVTEVPCSIADAHNVTIYETVTEIEAGLGISISDNITPDDQLILTLTDSEETNHPEGACFQIERIYTVADDCGNISTFTHTIKVVDTEKPVITTSAENNADFGCNPEAIAAPEFEGTDNCAGNISSNITVTEGEVIEEGCKRTQTWTATYTDACGNAADPVSITYTWTEDDEKPVIATTAENNKDWGCNPTNIVAPTFTGTDNCAGDISSENIRVTTDGPSNTGCSYTQTWTANYTDACGNAAEPVSITYTWTEDNVVPSIGTIVVPAAVPAGSCKYKIPDLSTATLAVSSDNCSGVSFVEQTPAAGSEYSQTNTEQTVTVVVKVKDVCNNEAAKEVLITIPAIPTISAAGSALDCYGDSDGNISYTITGGHANYTVVLSLAGTDLQTVTQTTDGDYSLSGLTAGTYTVTVTDANGCTATTSATVSQPASALTVSVSGTENVDCHGGNDGAVDISVSGGTTTYSYSWSNDATTEDLSSVPAGTYTVTVTDANGCTATASATVSQPASALSVSVAGTTSVKCYDGNDGAVDISVSGGTATYSYLWSNDATTEDLSGLTAGTYTVTVTDANGCTATASATVSQPASALTVSVATPTNLCPNQETYIVTASPIGGTTPYQYLWSEDAVGSTATGTITQLSTSDCNETYTATITVTDDHHCTATATKTFTVKDDIAPVITGTLAPVNVEGCAEAAAPAAYGTVSALRGAGLTIEDNCGLQEAVTYAQTSTGSCPIVITRTYTVTDLCGNSATVSQTIKVDDNTAPTITCSENLTRNTDLGKPYATVTLPNPTYGDNCSATYSISYSPATPANATATNASGQYPLGATTVTYSVVDGCGNANSCSFTVTVGDDENPEITCPPSMTVACETDTLPVLTTYDAFVAAGGDATDNDGIDATSFRLSGYSKVGTCPTTITRTYYIEDITGNSATCEQVITIKDSIAPALTGTWPANITGQDNCFANADISGLYTDAQVKELYNDCNEFTVSHTDANTSTADCGWTVTRTYTITDACGNETTNSMSVSGSDQTAPALAGTWPANLTNQNNCFANRDISGLLSTNSVKALYTDNCGGELTVTSRDTVTGNDCEWTVTRTYTITDACDNSVTKTMSVSGSDKTAPALKVAGTWPSDITEQNNCFVNRDISGLLSTDSVKALYTDNCGGELTVTSRDTVTGNDCEWTVTRTYTITDACDNSVTKTMSVSGSDKTAPALKVAGTWPSDITGQNNCFANRDISGLLSTDSVKALYTDNCGGELTVTSRDTVTGNDC